MESRVVYSSETGLDGERDVSSPCWGGSYHSCRQAESIG